MADSNLLSTPIHFLFFFYLKITKTLKQSSYASNVLYDGSKYELVPVPDSLAKGWCAGVTRINLEGGKGDIGGEST